MPHEERKRIAEAMAELEGPQKLSRTFSLPGRGTKDAAPGFDYDTRHQDSDGVAEPSAFDLARQDFGTDAMFLAYKICTSEDSALQGAEIVERIVTHCANGTEGLRVRTLPRLAAV